MEKHEFARFEVVCKILETEEPGRTGDPLIDDFERAIASGKTPDLGKWRKP